MSGRDAALRELLSVFAAIRAALASGGYHGLGELAERQTALAAALAQPPRAGTAQADHIDARLLNRVEREARRNRRLISAALEGLRAGAARRRAVRDAVSGTTYGPDGRREMLRPADRRLELRR